MKLSRKLSKQSFCAKVLHKIICNWNSLQCKLETHTYYLRCCCCCCCIFRVKMMMFARRLVQNRHNIKAAAISLSFFLSLTLSPAFMNWTTEELFQSAWLPPKIPLFSCTAAQCTEISQLRYEGEDYFCGFSEISKMNSISVGDPMWCEIKFMFTHDKILNDAIYFEVDGDPQLIQLKVYIFLKWVSKWVS